MAGDRPPQAPGLLAARPPLCVPAPCLISSAGFPGLQPRGQPRGLALPCRSVTNSCRTRDDEPLVLPIRVDCPSAGVWGTGGRSRPRRRTDSSSHTAPGEVCPVGPRRVQPPMSLSPEPRPPRHLHTHHFGFGVHVEASSPRDPQGWGLPAVPSLGRVARARRQVQLGRSAAGEAGVGVLPPHGAGPPGRRKERQPSPAPHAHRPGHRLQTPVLASHVHPADRRCRAKNKTNPENESAPRTLRSCPVV